jgi:Protein N-terminal asparagine amidohydrolase
MKKAQSCTHFASVGPTEPKNKYRGTRRTVLQVADEENPLATRPLLLLAHSESTPCRLNDYLKEHPQLAKQARQLKRLSKITPQTTLQRKVLNVFQSEVAHATPAQVDWLVSGEATTCHIIGLRSSRTSSSSSASSPPVLTSLAHVDECHLPSLDAIIQEHIQHHQCHTPDRDENNEEDFGYFLDALEEHDEDDDDDHADDLPPPWQAALASSSPTDLQHFPGFLTSQQQLRPGTSHDDHHEKGRAKSKVRMELHLVGGCDDPISYQLSLDLLDAWAVLGDRYSSLIEIQLVTAAISSLNVSGSSSRARNDADDNGQWSLLSRGMGIDCHTGHVFGLQSIADELQGPAVEIRQARLWARASNPENYRLGGSQNRLVVIHTSHSPEIYIEPYDYRPNPKLDMILRMPNDMLKQVTSTSPDLECENFCTEVRRSLSWLQLVPSEDVFGKQPHPLMYSRSASDVHQWEPHDESTRRALQASQLTHETT